MQVGAAVAISCASTSLIIYVLPELQPIGAPARPRHAPSGGRTSHLELELAGL
jgi:hypothetical protein